MALANEAERRQTYDVSTSRVAQVRELGAGRYMKGPRATAGNSERARCINARLNARALAFTQSAYEKESCGRG